jgi:DNA-3-methyladenine glycosylase
VHQLPPDFYDRGAAEVARDLIGCTIESRIRGVHTSGRIVEVEAYLGEDDPAAHSYGGRRTDRTEPMYGEPGTTYVYFTYGMHWCMNAVVGRAGLPSAVLIRAAEPVLGIDAMMRRRKTRNIKALCSGPAKLCRALGISGGLNYHRLQEPPLEIQGPADRLVSVSAGPRIGISRAKEWPLRFTERSSLWLSRPS